ncbi:response regulator transcription factor [Flagellimonas allohymeniacidonis]|uniref:LuxR family transcriptional regulator n=1 Tax=Flagellimonas allohymeniacidonis TaxID=2517819 RepID=A0A4Q8QG17_9FLAO|nr:helix-turn-helix transcriptional regulator [Allomuricauda hymeniacidonis]TAI48148.1 LuxR family transcriptional regulator [Allomuricauda hymeniacidonis]
MKHYTILFFLLAVISAKSQYRFSGMMGEEHADKPIYLSLVEDYRKSSRVYLDQIIRKTKVDSLGHFLFEGSNLLDENRIYRIHLDTCEEDSAEPHFLGQCNNSEDVLFIANNGDTLQFPTSFGEQALCDIISTNPKSDLLLQIDGLKEEMIFDFAEFRSSASQKLNSKKWFSKFQELGASWQEPLAELYAFDFLSDKRNETYGFYLQDVAKNMYYNDLLLRLKDVYPNTSFTNQYEAEFMTDAQLARFSVENSFDWKWILAILLLVSLGTNFVLLSKLKRKEKSRVSQRLEKLTPQEQKIVEFILLDKSNKEIAASLFVSHSTIKTHINNLYKKLQVSSRQEIIGLFRK